MNDCDIVVKFVTGRVLVFLDKVSLYKRGAYFRFGTKKSPRSLDGSYLTAFTTRYDWFIGLICRIGLGLWNLVVGCLDKGSG